MAGDCSANAGERRNILSRAERPIGSKSSNVWKGILTESHVQAAGHAAAMAMRGLSFRLHLISPSNREKIAYFIRDRVTHAEYIACSGQCGANEEFACRQMYYEYCV